MPVDLIDSMPKAELHVHIEGTLEPELYLFFAERNKIKVPYSTPEQVRDSLYQFHDLSSFIDVYLKASEVICTDEDFYDLTIAYLKKAHTQGVVHTEIFFDVQTSLLRNILPSVVIHGIYQALSDGYKQFGISSGMILSIMRNLNQTNAFKVLDIALKYKDKIIGIGLASVEKNNPPEKFASVFCAAKKHGFHVVAHAGEECGPDYIWQALDILHVERIDHGVRCIEDPQLVKLLAKKQIPLTVCPLSNRALGCFKSMTEHPLKKMFDAGLMVTINSDDPAFFKGYIADNYKAAQQLLGVSMDMLMQCARNSFKASFASPARKAECLRMLDEYSARYKVTKID